MKFFVGTLIICVAATSAAQSPTRSANQADTSACPSAPLPVSGAQATPRRDSSRAAAAPRPRAAPENATIILLASATAREVRFAAQPRILVRLCGAVTDSVRVVERKNLPDPVQPGATYRDVYIAVEIIGHLNAECLARRIGVAPQTAATSDPCASLSLRDSAQARTVPPNRPPR